MLRPSITELYGDIAQTWGTPAIITFFKERIVALQVRYDVTSDELFALHRASAPYDEITRVNQRLNYIKKALDANKVDLEELSNIRG